LHSVKKQWLEIKYVQFEKQTNTYMVK